MKIIINDLGDEEVYWEIREVDNTSWMMDVVSEIQRQVCNGYTSGKFNTGRNNERY